MVSWYITPCPEAGAVDAPLAKRYKFELLQEFYGACDIQDAQYPSAYTFRWHIRTTDDVGNHHTTQTGLYSNNLRDEGNYA
jgi:hypothetical protein